MVTTGSVRHRDCPPDAGGAGQEGPVARPGLAVRAEVDRADRLHRLHRRRADGGPVRTHPAAQSPHRLGHRNRLAGADDLATALAAVVRRGVLHVSRPARPMVAQAPGFAVQLDGDRHLVIASWLARRLGRMALDRRSPDGRCDHLGDHPVATSVRLVGVRRVLGADRSRG